MSFLFASLLPKLRGDFYEPGYVYFSKFPVRTINFNDPADAALHDQMVGLVDQMLALNQKLAAANIPQAKEVLKRQLASTDRQIDRLVYRLYGLTDEEIQIVEAGA